MKDSSIQAYLGSIEAARTIGDQTKSGEVFSEARKRLFEAEATTEQKAAAQSQFDGFTFYEELTSLGFYPQERRLAATFSIKNAFGYGGPIGTVGTYEYVGFWIDWNGDGDFNDTGEDVGSGYVHIFDPGAGSANKLGLCYAVYRDIIPMPNLKPGTIVRARAILSWQQKPTGPNFVPTWGNRLECNIRIDQMY